MLCSALRLLAIFLIHSHSYAAPSRRSLGDIDSLDDVLVLDAPAFQDGLSTKASVQAFSSLRQISVGPIADAFSTALENLGVTTGDTFGNLEDRVRLFGAIGLEGKQVKLKMDGCDDEILVKQTSGLPDLGMMLRTVDIEATCAASLLGKDEVSAKVQLTPTDKRNISTTIFPSGSDGFGVISGEQDKCIYRSSLVLTRKEKISMIPSRSHTP
jgi:hypothetical protein